MHVHTCLCFSNNDHSNNSTSTYGSLLCSALLSSGLFGLVNMLYIRLFDAQPTETQPLVLVNIDAADISMCTNVFALCDAIAMSDFTAFKVLLLLFKQWCIITSTY